MPGVFGLVSARSCGWWLWHVEASPDANSMHSVSSGKYGIDGLYNLILFIGVSSFPLPSAPHFLDETYVLNLSIRRRHLQKTIMLLLKKKEYFTGHVLAKLLSFHTLK